jgi:hypothetical protein
VNLSSVYSDIKQFLSISVDNFDLENNVNLYFNSEPDENKLELLADILSFVNYFSMFKEIKPFMNSLYNCINNTIEFTPDSMKDFEELLIKNSILYFVQEYIDYSQLTYKRKILKFLSDSLEKLQVQPLIINLGLLLKPMYQDQEYLDYLDKIKETEVTYISHNQAENQIKEKIDNWLRSQNITLDNQEEVKEHLKHEFESLAPKYNINQNEEIYERLQIEILEMFSMKLALLSLTIITSEDSLEPIPIK